MKPKLLTLFVLSALAGCANTARLVEPRAMAPMASEPTQPGVLPGDPAATARCPETVATTAPPPMPVATVDRPAIVQTVAHHSLPETRPLALAAEATAPEEPTASVAAPPHDLWERFRRGFAMPELDSPLVDQHARRFAQSRYLERMEGRARRYLYFILGEVEARGLPAELALLPFVESSLNPQARSPVGATGPWQFMPGTGRHYDLRISHLVDDRKNMMTSTRGALDYLETLHKQFDDWHLALASYNWGEYAVERARQRNRRFGAAEDYLALRMPRETAQYVPQLLALKLLVMNPDAYGVTLPELPNTAYFREVTVSRDIDVDLALRFSGLREADFFALNPSVRRPLLMAAATPRLLLPHNAASRFEQQLAVHRGPLARWTAHKIKSAERVESLARRYGTEARTLRDANLIPVNMKPQAGSTLLVPVPPHAGAISASTVAEAALTLAPDIVRVTITTRRKGETLAAIAQRHRLPLANLARWNKLKPKARLKAGQVVVAFVSPESAIRIAQAEEAAPAPNAKAHKRDGKRAKSREKPAEKATAAKRRTLT